MIPFRPFVGQMRAESLTATSGARVDWHWSFEDRGLYRLDVSAGGVIYNTAYGRYAGSRQLRGITAEGTGETGFDYDVERQLSSVDFPGAGRIDVTHDARHRLGRIEHATVDAAAALDAFYHHDNDGRMAQRYFATGGDASADSVWSYSYDAVGRLDQAVRSLLGYPCSSTPCNATRYPDLTFDFAWDDVGNPDGPGAVVTTGNRLEQYTTLAGDQLVLTYDADGNLIRKDRNGAWVATYTWNALGQLTNVSTPNFNLEYGYDALGNRVRRDHDGSVTQYVWAGGNLLAELDASGALTRHYSYYGGLDRPLSVYLESTDSAYFFLTEPPGHVVGMLREDGELVAEYEYAPFGRLLHSGGGHAASNTLRYGAREYDDIARLYYNRARYYDPEIGRFISEDPIGIAGGLNLYAYAAGNPIGFSDPTGLNPDPCPPGDSEAYCHHTLPTFSGGWLAEPVEGGFSITDPALIATATFGGFLPVTGGRNNLNGWEPSNSDDPDPDPEPCSAGWIHAEAMSTATSAAIKNGVAGAALGGFLGRTGGSLSGGAVGLVVGAVGGAPGAAVGTLVGGATGGWLGTLAGSYYGGLAGLAVGQVTGYVGGHLIATLACRANDGTLF